MACPLVLPCYNRIGAEKAGSPLAGVGSFLEPAASRSDIESIFSVIFDLANSITELNGFLQLGA